MKYTSIIAVLCLAIGFSAGWIAKPTNSTVEADDSESPRPAQRASASAANTPGNDSSDARSSSRSRVVVMGQDEEMDPETKKMIEESQNKQNEMIRKRFKDQFNLKITNLVRELGLNEAQEKELRAYFDTQLEKINLADMSELMNDPDKITEMAAAIRGDGLQDAMAAHLSPDQLEKLDAFQKKQHQNRIDSRALKDLAKLQQSLNLRDDQKDKVYNLLYEDAEKQINSQSDSDFLVRSMMSSMGMHFDMDDTDMGMVVGMQTANIGDGGPESVKDMMTQMKEARQKRIDEKVNRLAPVLDEGQLTQYRKNLESGGFFNMMMDQMEEE